MLNIKVLMIGVLGGMALGLNAMTVDMFTTENNTPIGTIELKQGKHGVLIKPALNSLRPGLHGLHLHVNPSCGKQGTDAGGHFDPADTKKHLGPYQPGHLGDLPVLYVDQSGQATLVTIAPRLNIEDFRGHALMIHKQGDNYSDTPLPLGGGGERFACGVIPLEVAG